MDLNLVMNSLSLQINLAEQKRNVVTGKFSEEQKKLASLQTTPSASITSISDQKAKVNDLNSKLQKVGGFLSNLQGKLINFQNLSLSENRTQFDEINSWII